MSSGDKDWTTPAARAELAALHAEVRQGTVHVAGMHINDVTGYCVADGSEDREARLYAASRNALPALLARIERDAALLARCADHCRREAAMFGGESGGSNAARLLADLRAAGFAPEGE